MCALLSLASCSRGGGASASSRKVALTPCRLEGVTKQTLCGTYEVWEDRAARQGRKIPLRIVLVPALAPSPSPEPLVLLAGGPGQAATELVGQVVPVFDRIQRNRDILFVDQRGTGASGPLECDQVSEDAPLAQQFDDTFREEVLRDCLARYDADPRLYTTPIAMDDLDEVREALGYQKLNLWGVSYGTRAALVYMRQHPERVRTAVLDGVAPLSLRLPLYMARDAQRALDLVFTHCEQDAACAQAYPELRTRFAALLAQLRQQPARVRVEHPLTGKSEDISISFGSFTSTLRGLLYSPEVTALMPLVLDRVMQGDWRPFVALGYSLNGGFSRTMTLGMYASVVCAEDAPFISEEDIVREAKGTWASEDLTRNLLRMCAVWPRGQVPAGYREPVRSEVPVLLLSGELDPVTPPSWAEDAKQTLPNSLHLTVPGVGHGAWTVGCVRSLMADFVARGSVQGLEPRCGKDFQRPPFFTSFAGPIPVSARPPEGAK